MNCALCCRFNWHVYASYDGTSTLFSRNPRGVRTPYHSQLDGYPSSNCKKSWKIEKYLDELRDGLVSSYMAKIEYLWLGGSRVASPKLFSGLVRYSKNKKLSLYKQSLLVSPLNLLSFFLPSSCLQKVRLFIINSDALLLKSCCSDQRVRRQTSLVLLASSCSCILKISNSQDWFCFSWTQSRSDLMGRKNQHNHSR